MFDMLSYFHLGLYNFESQQQQNSNFQRHFRALKKGWGNGATSIKFWVCKKHFKIMFSVFKRPGKLIVQKVNHSVKQEKKK